MLFVTIHPSYLLRIPDERLKAEEMVRFRQDMMEIQRLMSMLGESDSAGSGGLA